MSVSLKTSNTSSYVNVLPPGSQGEAIFVGSTSGNDFTGTLAATDDYAVRVHLIPRRRDGREEGLVMCRRRR